MSGGGIRQLDLDKMFTTHKSALTDRKRTEKKKKKGRKKKTAMDSGGRSFLFY